MQLFIKTLTGQTITIEIDTENKTVRDLMQAIHAEVGIPLDRQQLIIAGKLIGRTGGSDENRLLNKKIGEVWDYKEGAVINLALKSNYERHFKMQIVGDSGVGKSCLMLRFSDGVYTESYLSTVGVNHKVKDIYLDNILVKLQVCDGAEQGRFRSIKSNNFRGSHAFIVCYDVSDQVSFNNVKAWLDDINRFGFTDVPKILVGCKADLTTKNVVDYNTAKDLADKFDMEFIETSAKTGVNVEKAFELVTSSILKHNPIKQEQPTIGDMVIQSQNGHSSSSSCLSAFFKPKPLAAASVSAVSASVGTVLLLASIVAIGTVAWPLVAIGFAIAGTLLLPCTLGYSGYAAYSAYENFKENNGGYSPVAGK